MTRQLHCEEFTTLDGDHYTGATLRRVEPDGLVIAYADGVKKLKFQNLPAEIGKQYGYNPAVAAQYLAQQQASAAASYYAKIQSTQPASISQNIATESTTPPSKKSTPQIKSENASPSFFKRFLSLGLRHLFPWAFPTIAIPPPPPIATPTPEEQLQSIAAGTLIDSSKLASLCELYPMQAQVILKARRVKVTGRIKRIMVRGISSADFDVDLEGTERFPVNFTTNYDTYNTEHTGSDSYGYKLVKEGRSLLLYSERMTRDVGRITAFNRVICTINDLVTLEGGIKNISKYGEVEINWAPGIESKIKFSLN